ncbi:type II secretion system F family protein [Hydrogenovibrio marinus]|uniref:Type II secretion system protein n=1 Tax=Hydrogenovibrio marinus TaxID=28885 RepID=A0A066ZTB1_HYDMR|nr:type II secretion system F family protein [Hydrogenovibrio marinus]KDN96692.1 type II secretion system protein [Hydrogenovibrio marinus]
MDIGFLLLVVAITIPFAILAFGLNWKALQHKDERLQLLLKRAGIEQTQQKKIQKSLYEINRSKTYLRLMSWLKKAGITEQIAIYQLVAAEVFLLMASSYLIVTRLHSMDSKLFVITALLPLFPIAYVIIRKQKRQEKMRKQFPEMLDALVRALHSGYGIDGGLNMIANEFPQPLGQEMKEVTRQLALGINMREILREFQSRVELQEAQFFVVTLIIQRETGGQLAAILSELSRLMRRREVFQAKLRTMTAESRFTAIFIGSAPLLYLAYKYLFDPKSMQFFLSDPLGQKMLYVSLILIGTGTILLKKMLRIRF